MLLPNNIYWYCDIPLHFVHCILIVKLWENIIYKSLHKRKKKKPLLNSICIGWENIIKINITKWVFIGNYLQKNTIVQERWLGINHFCLLSQVIFYLGLFDHVNEANHFLLAELPQGARGKAIATVG